LPLAIDSGQGLARQFPLRGETIDMNVIDAIRHHARMRPYEHAVLHPAGPVNYQLLSSVIAGLAVRLRSHGVEPGMTAAIYVSDPFLHLALILAAMVNGTVSISAHPNYDAIPAEAEVDAYLADRTLPFATSARVVTVGANWLADIQDARPAQLQSGFTDPQAVCRKYTSSGTTGVPKVIGHTTAILESMSLRGLALEPLAQGPNLSMMWMSTIGGFGTCKTTLWHGTTLVMATAPLTVLRAINLYKVTMLRASPQQLQALVEMVRGRPVRFPSLQRLEVGGASTPAPLLLAARAALCPNVIGIYGSTETGLVAQAPGALMQAQPDALGYVVPGAQVRIVDDEGKVVGPDTEGALQVRTPYMASGYVGDEKATVAAFQDGWFIPGDLGLLSAQGVLHLRGRADEMINAGGVKLNPALVDEFLMAQPGVADAAAFAHRQPGRHDQVWAAIVCAEQFDQRALLAACQARLNSRAPVRLVRMAEIPRNAMGKALRQQLSAQAPAAAT